MALMGKKLAIDFGTSSTRVYVPKKGVVVNEPTVIAIDDTTDKHTVVAVGRHAQEMVGKTPEELSIITPMKSGVIANFEAAATTLSRFITLATSRFHLSRPIAMITVSSTSTSTEKKAMIDAGIDAGLQNVYLIEQAVASALGAGIAITEPVGSMVVDIGAGTTESAIFSLGGIVSDGAIRVAGNDIDEAIKLYARREHGILLGKTEVYALKSKFLDLKHTDNKSINVTGQSIVGGLPKKVTFKHKQLVGYIDMPLDKIVRSIRKVVEKAPPDVIGDIVKHGVVITGGTSQLKGISYYLTKQLNLACVVAENPELAGIKGAHVALTHLEDYRRSLLA